LQQEDIEEDENDDFENLYKGQISKSGIAILPSKRTRKIPEVKKAIAVNEETSTTAKEQPEAKEISTASVEDSKVEDIPSEPLTLKEEVTE
jgi:DNA-directed RNA polymerase subunit omega